MTNSEEKDPELEGVLSRESTRLNFLLTAVGDSRLFGPVKPWKQIPVQ